jgi:predicted PurR-regulated permease PerM
MMPDRLRSLFSERTFSRVFAIALFLLLLFLFRHLWALFVFFVAFERAFRWLQAKICGRFGLSKRLVLFSLLGVFLGSGVGLIAFGVLSGFHRWQALQGSSVEWIGELRRHPLYEKLHSVVDDGGALVDHAKDYAEQAWKYVSAVGRFFIQATVGFILAIVYRLEADELDKFEDRIDPKSLIGRLLRWLEHVADAVSVTIQLQLVVAIFNTVTTLPVLFFLGIPHIPSLMALIFVSALVPVIGNLVAGAVLCLLAYQAKGWLGVAIFVGVTFVLHKVESYYLSPRLTARHVRVPGFVLITSLVAFEHLFGFAGVFLSFPALFVAARIRAEFLEEDGALPPESIRPGRSLSRPPPTPRSQAAE